MTLYAKIKYIQRERGCSYREACSILGRRSAARAAAQKRRGERESAALDRERQRQAAMKID